MQITRENLSPTSTKLTIVADQSAIDQVKDIVLSRLSKDIKLPGFRPGKAPTELVEKQVDQSVLQSEFLNEAMNLMYDQAIRSENVRVVAQPEINITKFVPFTTLEFTAEVESVGDIKLTDYKKIKMIPEKVEVNAKEVNDVIDNLRERASERKEVEREAKDGDEIVIDFKGVDAKTKELIEGAEGNAYPLVLGSKAFIPGFEDELVGLKAGDKKSFNITFPEDYGAASLQSRKVTFDVEVHKVEELVKPKADDEFAGKVGPFKTIAELKTDIKKQLKQEKENQAKQKFDNDLLQKIADLSEVPLPSSLVEDEVVRLEEDEKRSIAYRGQTWQEHLDEEGVTEEQHKERQRPVAETRIKVGLLLGEIAEKEGISVNENELELKLEQLKKQYTDPTMQEELDKPENRRDIYSRLMIEKTIDRLNVIVTAKSKTAAK
jgi:trigger factor